MEFINGFQGVVIPTKEEKNREDKVYKKFKNSVSFTMDELRTNEYSKK